MMDETPHTAPGEHEQDLATQSTTGSNDPLLNALFDQLRDIASNLQTISTHMDSFEARRSTAKSPPPTATTHHSPTVCTFPSSKSLPMASRPHFKSSCSMVHNTTLDNYFVTFLATPPFLFRAEFSHALLSCLHPSMKTTDEIFYCLPQIHLVTLMHAIVAQHSVNVLLTFKTDLLTFIAFADYIYPHGI